MKKIWNKILEIATRPLPDGVCAALGEPPPCMMCWSCVGMGIFIAVVVILFVGLF